MATSYTTTKLSHYALLQMPARARGLGLFTCVRVCRRKLRRACAMACARERASSAGRAPQDMPQEAGATAPEARRHATMLCAGRLYAAQPPPFTAAPSEGAGRGGSPRPPHRATGMAIPTRALPPRCACRQQLASSVRAAARRQQLAAALTPPPPPTTTTRFSASSKSPHHHTSACCT